MTFHRQVQNFQKYVGGLFNYFFAVMRLGKSFICFFFFLSVCIFNNYQEVKKNRTNLPFASFPNFCVFGVITQQIPFLVLVSFLSFLPSLLTADKTALYFIFIRICTSSTLCIPVTQLIQAYRHENSLMH